MTSPRLLLWIGAALCIGALAAVLSCCAVPTHPKQILDAPCGSLVDERKDYGPACDEEPTCIEHANGVRECFCAYTEAPNG